MFNQKLSEAAELTERYLGALLEQTSVNVPARLAEAMRYGVLGPGKRFRPFLALESAGLFGISRQFALPAAAALELIHCYSLVHDDLPAMDDDDVRRGRPTVHVKFDEATAILVGDALLTLAFEVLAGPGADPDPIVRAALTLELARAAGAQGMVGGQQLDLEAEHRRVDLQGIAHIQAMKTGRLIMFACDAGAHLGRACERDRAALATYARALGLAFQVSDDLLDVVGDATRVGKRVAKDAALGKATFVSLLGIDGARRKLAELEAEAVAALAPFGERAAVLAEAARYVAGRER